MARPGRQGGTALADLDRDGKYEVVTAFWQPGEMLSSSGQSASAIPHRPSPSSTRESLAAASWRNSRHVRSRCFCSGHRPDMSTRMTRAESCTGGRRWGRDSGRVAVGRLTDGPELSVVASWNGGIAAIDSSGRILWQKDVPTPTGSVPVLVDLDGDHKLDIVLNAGSEILALKGDSGATLWEYSVPGARFVTPAAGEFVSQGETQNCHWR